jgi:ATP-dependent exoDNAse (exonuclease V) alpha subunit
MAIYHFSAQIIGRSAGRSSTACAAYRAGAVLVDERTGVKHDFSRKKGILHTEILAPANAPSWVHNRSDLWNKVEKIEKRKDSQLCREINVALPAELDEADQLELVREYVERNFVSTGMVADLCIHAPSKDDNSKNYHAHIMLTMRRLADDEFGLKEVSWNAVELLERWRKTWAELCNAALEKAGHTVRIDHRSHAARGIEEQPTQHHGPSVAGILRRGEDSEVAERQDAESAARAAAQLAAQLAIARAQATAAFEELAAAEAEAQAEADAKARKERAAAEAAAAKRTEVADALALARGRQALAHVQAEAQAVARQQQAAAELAQALVHARQQHAIAELELAKAVEAEALAETQANALRPAHDAAVDEQRRAGQNLFETAKELPKISVWNRAIGTYEVAVQALKSASDVVQRARQAVARLWAKVLQLDPGERERQASAHAAQVAQTAQIEDRAEAERKRQQVLAVLKESKNLAARPRS